jgi:predicted Zn-dependent protease
VLLKFSRTAESQADITGAHLMAESGYDPMQMAAFFEKLSAQGGQSAPQFLSDHPNPENRNRAIQEEAQRMPAQNYGFQTGQFAQMKQTVSKIKEPAPKAAPAQ